MDDLAAQLSSSFQVTKSHHNVHSEHPRFSQYKSKSSKSDNQNKRRETCLQRQKKQRYDYLNHVRGLATSQWDEKEDDEEDMDVVQRRPPPRYKDQIMLSEWLVDVPADFNQEWLMLVCPKGKRNLVVAGSCCTSAYSKGGYRVETFASSLPGGSYNSSPASYCVLDCIYNELERTFYVLDVMCWNNHPFYDSETDFRFFMLHSKFQETPELATVSDTNTYAFKALKNYPCMNDDITNAVKEWDYDMIDGLLFYHKRTHYTFGSTPLVTWLKVPMLKDVLDIDCEHLIPKNVEMKEVKDDDKAQGDK